MVQVAAERIDDLFALAEREATGLQPGLADRYVRLARRIGMRYNVRLLPEYSERFCRGCSTFWVEGRNVRTRLRQGRRVRRCLRCGRERRVPFRRARAASARRAARGRRLARQQEVALVGGARSVPEAVSGPVEREGG